MDDKSNKRQVSAKKLVANRSNGKRSHGPVTDAGKAKSAQNAYKHGLFAARLFPNAEQRLRDGADYDTMYAGFCNHYSPVGYLEHFWVEKIATEALRLARLLGFEQQVFNYKEPFETQSAGRLRQYESTVSRQFMKAIDYLEQLQENRKAESNQPESQPDNSSDEPDEMDVAAEEPTELNAGGSSPDASLKAASEKPEAAASHGLDTSEAAPSNEPEETSGTNPPSGSRFIENSEDDSLIDALREEKSEDPDLLE